jgi:hypothetical protein
VIQTLRRSFNNPRGGLAVRVLLATIVLGLVFGNLLRGEIHAHANAGADHAHQAWHDGHDDNETASDEPSLHGHAVVAPVVMQAFVPPVLHIPVSPSGWIADDASTVPRSATHGTPHRPPIA